MTATRTAYRTCPLCEATCGLELTLEGDRVTRVRGDAADVFSKGFLCPKGVAVQDLHEDPDRLRAPLVRGEDGELREATWEEAFAAVDAGLRPVLEAGGRDAVAVYLGNPAAHALGPQLYGPALLKAIGSRNVFSASTVDQMPKQLAAGHMFGAGLSVPVPDVDRTDLLLVLGANPLASNGSLLTAPDLRGRLRALRARGGRLVVVDPRRSRTAEEADEHLAIRPGTDAVLLAALVREVVARDAVALGRAEGLVEGLDAVRELVEPFTVEAAARTCGIPAEAIERLADALLAAPTAAVYGRMGTTTQRFGTLASWLVDVLNVVTGNLDREGGAMFPLAAAGQRNATGTPGRGRGIATGRWASRVRGLPEMFGELPVAALAEEIETPGEGQVRALVTIAGNPVLSTPDGARLAAAISSLDFVVSVDPYVNETTRHADVILPPPSVLERSHYDLALRQLAIRSVATYSPPVLERAPGTPDEWEILARLALVAAGQGPDADVEAFDDLVAGEAVRRETVKRGGPLEGRDPAEILEALAERRGPERLLDLSLRAGPFGDAFGVVPGGLTLARLEAEPHGIDLGPMRPRLPDLLRTASGRIELAPEPVVADVPRLVAALDEDPGALLLVGRRHLRSNNSWMHNLPRLVRGPERCTLHVHPEDAAALGLEDGGRARVLGPERPANGAGPVRPAIEVPVEVTEDIRPGVVSVPHGWGHDAQGARLGVAREHAGANVNLLADPRLLDPLSGNAVLNGIPVEVEPVPSGVTTAAVG